MVSLNLGGGLGLFSGMGAPDWRAFFGMSVAPDFDPSAKDADKDGLSDAVDACPERAEDLDSYQDKDGCPDLDNDLDKIPDDKDTCPNDPEDDDSFQDADGCPDADNDGDGVPDISDRCPLESETENGYQDDDGCPDSKPRGDSDNDRYTDDIDRCPNDPEDYDGFQDEDGCPDPDNDSDGIPDVSDRCKDMAETFDGVEDTDGCPETRVQIQGTSIKISERIFFDTGRNTIQDRSHALLDEIASVIVAHPELKKIRIEGHTDNVGPDNNNLRLSQARAEAVRDYLVRKGVAPARLDARGFGEMYPLASNDTEAGRAENRRVEFIIAERD
jgi:outer membrane protein OmpA-like peptidoglycan-associated protein